jgi:isoaspartyl peptidase/L-asparaginase-like protein (Ntn-hydrolase superfamily)
MLNRREFLRIGGLTGAGLAVVRRAGAAQAEPRIVSTHPAGVAANRRALEVLRAGASPLDAAQQGVMVTEADPENTSVGYGAWPNARGVIELDAAVMDGETLNAGAVAGLRNVLHPVAVAREVMRETPHVLLVGEGALRFALSRGFEKQNLMTPEMRRKWKRFRRTGDDNGEPDHDTIGMVTRDAAGKMAAVCTTSGLRGKLPGRVGDSPLIGHGLYCDQRAGGAAATGVGEEIIKVCGSYQVVEFMRQGATPAEAIRRVVRRIERRDPGNRGKLFGFVALRADGEIGHGALMPGFQAAVTIGERTELRDAESLVPGEADR